MTRIRNNPRDITNFDKSDPEANRNHGKKRKNRSRKSIRKMETLTLIMTIYSTLKEITQSWIRALNEKEQGKAHQATQKYATPDHSTA